MQWGFVDYENVGSLETIDLGKYDRIFVFLGPKNKQLKLGGNSPVGFCSIDLISLKTIGPNNLDFHLAFHLGRFHELAEELIEFHIITNDSGFNGLINHIKGLGRRCKKVTLERNDKKSQRIVSLSPGAELIVARLAPMDGRKRPRTTIKLKNWIKSQCTQVMNDTDPGEYYEELKNTKIIHENELRITYNDKAIKVRSGRLSA